MAIPRITVVGSGFAGFYAARRLEKLIPKGAAELVMITPRDYLLYSPLLPEVVTGTLGPRDIAVSLRQKLRHTRIVLGQVLDADFDAATLKVRTHGRGTVDMSYDRLVLAPGSVTKQFDIPGVAENARGLKTLAEATFLRDHLLGQLDLVDALGDTEDDRVEREQRLTVVAVGAGYTGAETVAQAQHAMKSITRRWTSLCADDLRWILVDLADKVLPELGDDLGERALAYLRERGVDVRLGVTVKRASETEIELTDGTTVPSRTLLWGAGVAPSPLIKQLGLDTHKGRLIVDARCRVVGLDHVWAVGDSAAVPDLSKKIGPDGKHPVAGMTAQNAQRQGTAVARNVAASIGLGVAKNYKHRDLGLVADFGGTDAVAKPLGIELTGIVAKNVARGYHVYALPAMSNRIRVGVSWLLRALLPAQAIDLGVVDPKDAVISKAQRIDLYPS